ncbi:MAG: two-component regulator propeller domain-containing protein [Cryomorphaceae bacterium]
MGRIFQFLLIIAAVGFLVSPPVDLFAQEYLYDRWGVKEGLPQNTVNQVIQTRDGYIWLATESGLTRFDGVEFTTFNTENTPAIKSNRIKILFENNNGDLLIGSHNGGLAAFRENQFFNITGPEVLHNSSVYQFAVDDNNVLWLFVASQTHLIGLYADTYEPVMDVDPPNWHRLSAQLPLHEKFLPLSFDLVGFKDVTSPSGNKRDAPKPQYVVRAAIPGAAANTQWMIDATHLFRCEDFSCTEKFPLPKAYLDNGAKIFSLVNDKLYLRVTSCPDLLVFDVSSETFSLLNGAEICPNGTVFQVYPDREGNIWYATSICGLVKAKPPRFTYLDAEDRAPVQNFYAIKRDEEGRTLIGTISNDLIIFDADDNLIETPDYLPKIRSFLPSIEIFEGAIYLSVVVYDHIYKWQNDAVERINFTDTIPRHTNAIYASGRGELLVGTQLGVFVMIDGRLEPHPVSGKEPALDVNTFLDDNEGRIWMAGDRKIVCYNPANGRIEFNSDDFTDEDRFYRGMSIDDEGRIYVGSYGFGLHVIEDGRFHRITVGQGLAENVVSTVTEDSKGNIWFTGNIGLSRIVKSDLLELLAGDRKKVSAVLYNEQTDGLRTGEFNGGIQQAKCWLGGERYIFPSMKGAVIVDFADMRFNTLPPPVHIEQLSYNDSLFLAAPKLELTYAAGRLDISYTALSFVSPENVRFKYRLEGYDREWIDAGSERKTSYSKIPPGDYTFRVIACNNEGVWNEEGSAMALSIIPPFYMTWWFRIVAIAFGFFLTIFSVSRIIAFRRKRERDKSALMDILPDLVFKMDRNGRFVDMYGNPDNLTRPIPERYHRSLDDLLPDGLTDEARRLIDRAFETGAMQEHTYEVSGGKTFESRYIAIDRYEVLCIIRDITAAKEAERKIRKGEKKLFKALEKEKELLKAITRQQKMQLEAIVNTEEKERKRIARDLHDGVGQLLSSVKINLGVAREYIAQSKFLETTELVDVSRSAIDEITEELRNISYNLLPPSLEQFGLASAIAEEVNKLKTNPELFVHFDNSTTDIKFDPKVEIVLFRVFQELLNNALKHADASEITIQLIQHKTELVLMIEDDGTGFELRESVEKKDSSGLKNLYSRINFIDGKITVDSTPSSGTSIIIEIPLKP